MTMNSPNLIEGREFQFYDGQAIFSGEPPTMPASPSIPQARCPIFTWPIRATIA
jgi:hypothetical protein